ncbi:nuclear transport factor 2 family protein [Kribbella shirazensis]|uniref:SnoaL-like domain-containing protein n=1 Tax=Kribbella shirazensis TaxID=1105143 RepID=A0A7X6A5D2_9ACTN|nr:nuclear transport factor 2 family protein [Kribbella shirazensis]NIK61985.1 hypothetical protein [Kribbella shirazensis]
MLPDTITRYLAAHTARDADAAIQWFADDATVTDEGRTHHGADEIHAWLSNGATEYTYTAELIAAHRPDAHTYVATHHLEGDFPGGTVDLDFVFTLDDTDTTITSLAIAPPGKP